MATEAQLRAQKKYDEANRDRWKLVQLKLNKNTDSDIIQRLGTVRSMNGYIKDLIRKDIEESQS